MATDQELHQRLRQNDRSAFEAIVQKYQRGVFAYLRSRVFCTSDAEDLTQEVFLRFYQGRERFDGANMIRPWLMGIARNLLKEHVRKCRRRKEVAWTELCLELDELVQAHASESNDSQEDTLKNLPDCLASLGQSAREAIHLRYSSGLALLDIGRQLKRSEGAIKLLMFRARQALKYCLDGKTRKPS
ncbi:MAG: polymerase sigma factor, sigma-70 family [Planctomycetaceae bacterium]|nr:polymerase sigma factor, sigma-70 family [Planctomycetaceae bacterium]